MILVCQVYRKLEIKFKNLVTKILNEPIPYFTNFKLSYFSIICENMEPLLTDNAR